MTKVHTEILDEKRLGIFRKLGQIDESVYLIGGTAIALQIRHRKSVDFDLAVTTPIKKSLLVKINKVYDEDKITASIDQPSELTFFLNRDVKITLLHYPYENLHPLVETPYLNMASLEDLATTKAQTIGRRGEWKDYVDIYFLLTKAGLKIEKIIKETKKRFGGEFSEKLFWEQLVYWEDLTDYEIDYIDKKIPKSKIQAYFSELTKKRLSEVL